MKKGFKPKAFTAKEWTDNAAPVCLGIGVEKALNEWQNSCLYNFSKMEDKEYREALAAAIKLEKALLAAKKKCDKTAQKETLAGIGEYLKVVARYKKDVAVTAQVSAQRQVMLKDLNLKKIEKSSALWQLYRKYFKDEVHSAAQFDTYELCKKKKYAEAVKKYGCKDGKEGAYNIRPTHNQVLINEFVENVPVDKKKLAKAINELETVMYRNVSDVRYITRFSQWWLTRKFVDSKLKTQAPKDFKV